MKTNYSLFFPVFFLLVLTTCERSTPALSLGIEESYYLERMRSYLFAPAWTGEEYRWTMRLVNGQDTLLSTEQYYTFVHKDEGIYHLTFEIIDPMTPYKHDFTVEVVHEYVEYSPYISSVYEYYPAPGQFVNELPQYEEGDTPESMRRKVEENISGTNDVMITLGGFGGYVTFSFDHTVMNVPGQYDFAIYGNAFYSLVDVGRQGGSCEPGIVMVAFDKNKNGKPDEDEWYELAGSEYYKPETIKNYEITFYRPDEGKVPTPDVTGDLTDTTYIRWEDNQGDKGFMPKLSFHKQDYYPKWVNEDKLTFKGTKLKNNGENISGMGSYWVLYAYEWGYADNHPNDSLSQISFDIDWAVDKEGNPVHLPGADFIRVYTALNQNCGWIGETSTEVIRARDWHIYAGDEKLPDISEQMDRIRQRKNETIITDK